MEIGEPAGDLVSKPNPSAFVVLEILDLAKALGCLLARLVRSAEIFSLF